MKHVASLAEPQCSSLPSQPLGLDLDALEGGQRQHRQVAEAVLLGDTPFNEEGQAISRGRGAGTSATATPRQPGGEIRSDDKGIFPIAIGAPEACESVRNQVVWVYSSDMASAIRASVATRLGRLART